MSNEITSILQLLAPQHKTPGQARSAPQPTVIDKPATLPNVQVTLSDSARLLQLAESKPARNIAPKLDSSDAGMTSVRTDTNVQSASDRITAGGNAQNPSPAKANMMAAFLTTSDMDGFDVNSDLNSDGVINFQDLAALRAIEMGSGTEPPEDPKVLYQNMTEAFLSSEGSQEFDAASDLNDDGMINFEDLAMLRSRLVDN